MQLVLSGRQGYCSSDQSQSKCRDQDRKIRVRGEERWPWGWGNGPWKKAYPAADRLLKRGSFEVPG